MDCRRRLTAKQPTLQDSPEFFTIERDSPTPSSPPYYISASPPITTFGEPASPPPNLPLRPPPQTPVWEQLDSLYEPKTPVPSPNRGVVKQAAVALDQHIKDRLPYMQLAGKRLQAVMGVRNDTPFHLPQPPVVMKGPFGEALPSPSSSMGRNGESSGSPVRRRRRDSGIGMAMGSASALNGEVLGMHVVDKETGKGLREFLLLKGKECGMRKRQCKSISFHDITPLVRTDTCTHRNILLGHYGIGSAADRVDAYEIDLPTIAIDPMTGTTDQATESWLWFLISRPLISFDPADTSTRVREPSSSSSSSPYSSLYSSSPDPEFPEPPPNYPSPMPTSWLVIAVPKAHITEYPTTTENLPSTPESSAKKGRYPFAAAAAGWKVQKRADYDISHSGIPLFEFSSADLFSEFTSTRCEFVSIENIGPFHSSDAYEPWSAEEWGQLQAEFEEQRAKWAGGGGYGEAMLDGDEAGALCPYKGVWWGRFWSEMWADVERWQQVRRSMGRAKCRVVVRWEEWESEGREKSGVKRSRSGLGLVEGSGAVGARENGKRKRRE